MRRAALPPVQIIKMQHFKQKKLKRFGILDFYAQNHPDQLIDQLSDFIKIVYVREGSKLNIDFTDLAAKQDAIVFVTAGQILRLAESFRGSIIYYNHDFYGLRLHDQEIAFDEMLFDKVQKVPSITLNTADSKSILSVFDEIRREITQNDINQEEMVRVLLKQVIIKATRICQHMKGATDLSAQQDSGFCRFFIQLVERNFFKYHDVASYANILNISAKALNKRVCKHSCYTPNEIIKRRIILEAKRLLVYTHLSVKEIGYKLGYEDPSYFIRFFSKQVKAAPQTFRLHFQGSFNAVA
ncbi:AraC-type DNA-binding protein [Mucilaginibacter gossypiicola]|uniref:AraC-type DNA-binding protein n=2 Tax=Mucilaginibacter gossypiicola TaxID=551995 RepID=A0A1H8BEA1_9SPHI|nr:AraC-type DNA-binding protein [Mucilaginibacter gossypiicola]